MCSVRETCQRRSSRSEPRFTSLQTPRYRDQSIDNMTRPEYARIKVCALARMSIARTGFAEFVITIPRPPDQPRLHSMVKLRWWATTPLLSSPDILTGSSMGTHPPLRPRHAPMGIAPYAWRYHGGGVIMGRTLEAKHNPTQQVNLL